MPSWKPYLGRQLSKDLKLEAVSSKGDKLATRPRVRSRRRALRNPRARVAKTKEPLPRRQRVVLRQKTKQESEVPGDAAGTPAAWQGQACSQGLSIQGTVVIANLQVHNGQSVSNVNCRHPPLYTCKVVSTCFSYIGCSGTFFWDYHITWKTT